MKIHKRSTKSRKFESTRRLNSDTFKIRNLKKQKKFETKKTHSESVHEALDILWRDPKSHPMFFSFEERNRKKEMILKRNQKRSCSYVICYHDKKRNKP
jgi:hypothetical protein